MWMRTRCERQPWVLVLCNHLKRKQNPSSKKLEVNASFLEAVGATSNHGD